MHQTMFNKQLHYCYFLQVSETKPALNPLSPSTFNKLLKSVNLPDKALVLVLVLGLYFLSCFQHCCARQYKYTV